MNDRKIVVIGNGMVGHHFVETLVGLGTGDHITVIGEEPRPAYDRVHLSEVFCGREPAELALATRDTYREWGVQAVFGDPVTRIERAAKTVVTASGRRFDYHKLVMATGSYPFVPPVSGADHERCLVYRTIDDLGRIKAAAKDSRTGVVVGGGLLGLECANALRNLDLETHVVEFAPGLMGVQLDEGGSRMLRRKIEALGVRVHTSKNTREIVDGSGAALAMNFADEAVLDTDMIVFSAGIRPRDQLARESELAVGERGGIVIDYKCKTSDSDIFAIGECALFGGRIYGLVAPGYRMAEVVANQLAGEPAQFQGADMSTKLKLLGVDVGSIGDAHARIEGSISYVFSDERAEVYKRIVTSGDGKTLLGAVLVGDCEDYDTLLQYFLNGIELPAEPESLIVPAAGDKPLLGAAALPMSATVCSCHNVTKGGIVEALDSGCCSLGEVKAETRASTGCGGCAAMLKNLVEDELSARGVTVDKSICEHFPHTRQELYHLARVGELKTFDDMLAKHGRGRGCDICKPAVASIMASLWNEHVLEMPHVGLQDTNDTFLANMQKDGTYSVVPRIAGGEITPDKLIVLGEVAKKYGLYTKITGGQRIDLFGARQHELPDIWRELVAAGFETGHAYGKALRTVKSCVGSTWCRYGVQDSVGMAIYIENRYKGLRAPHKIKSAVSGCTRECAEAQSKDFGVIATENGWNLYVCGNGGMKPRHADLFATDLDDETLIRYIDRFLMFYIRTADRLQRTSVWMDNLEGGLDYLREVVIEDSLGICSELEQQMASVVGTYQCEWNTTINDPEKLKRFRQFVNADGGDPEVVFVQERGQNRPARPEEKIRLVARVASAAGAK
ncbi:nitrite reductase large subunit NirB [Parahaliea mediterranea]|uniref:Nitrite reductase large subunit n=1 Tax=Parahaliea mediterranea TaxID=651086 RepID=A0A939DEF8_9GAMM|nr:nitrite reductase large subunit NirB [Parahaliea mediterranea]MBN7796733.1 nitrite reductase large subunit [Parahaliea mediterranea]